MDIDGYGKFANKNGNNCPNKATSSINQWHPLVVWLKLAHLRIPINCGPSVFAEIAL